MTSIPDAVFHAQQAAATAFPAAGDQANAPLGIDIALPVQFHIVNTDAVAWAECSRSFRQNWSSAEPRSTTVQFLRDLADQA